MTSAAQFIINLHSQQGKVVRKTENMRITKLIPTAALLVALPTIAISSANALPESQVTAIKKAVTGVPAPELAAKAAEIVSQADKQDRLEVGVTVVRAIVALSPASAPVVVAAIAKVAPEIAPAVAAAATQLAPDQAVAIAKAAATAAPAQAVRIATALAEAAPRLAASIAEVVAAAAPNASPALKARIRTAAHEASAASPTFSKTRINGEAFPADTTLPTKVVDITPVTYGRSQ
ncbi:MAG: hypothetical protein HY674_12875 [Chloroflexi bacterium]|nr:hypothetical protein [Chloroflexota bacterium]